MDWMNQLGNVLGRYANQPGTQPANPQTPAQQGYSQQVSSQQGYGPVDDDYDQVVQHAPPQALAQGLAGAFRSPDTPPFGSMTAQMFSQSNPQQRADLLNTLLRAAGPTVLSQVMNRGAMTGGQGGGRSGQSRAGCWERWAVAALSAACWVAVRPVNRRRKCRSRCRKSRPNRPRRFRRRPWKNSPLMPSIRTLPSSIRFRISTRSNRLS
jgi:hypothetical protein